eukprot:CAMPEP_0206381418 /NCGR_PEP_ID=MMETSP0294-20121207/12634_1 /ASSEMBLY_ACC=CAM_ASM_000327 /TAXON_ID=39354 /ORGANISM="Heterosigma akashiwo, Strain CCMP2393" /LENGTH=290 /DNA_ID=CAMNT_0053830867 /DNA_START=144 /DNA_END=1015 /DNA_ORIENTATION=-
MQTRSSPSLSTLHGLAKQAQLEKFEKLSKKELYARLKQQYDFERLKRAQKFSYKRKLEESHEGGASSSAPGSGCGSHDAAPCCTVQEPAMKKRRSGSINIVDPIMFTKVGKQKFVYVRPNGKAVQYNIAPLVDYILCTGDFCEPETRIPFTDADLKKIDEAAIKYNLKKQSVLEARKNVAFYSELKFRRDAIFGLERCLAELAAGMLAAVEEADWELAELAADAAGDAAAAGVRGRLGAAARGGRAGGPRGAAPPPRVPGGPAQPARARPAGPAGRRAGVSRPTGTGHPA